MEYIGFFISFLALVYLYYQQHKLAQRRLQQRRAAGLPEQEPQDPLKSLIEAMAREAEKESASKELPPPPPKKKKRVRTEVKSNLATYHLESSVEHRQLKSKLANRHLKPTVGHHLEAGKSTASSLLVENIVSKPSRALKALERLSHPRDMLIYQEIIDKPKSLRPFR